MKKRLSERTLQAMRAPSQGRVELFDTLLPGFGVRMGTSGKRSFFVMYRVHGKQRRQTLGAYPVVSLAEAREAARAALGLAQGGLDPVLEQTRQARAHFATVAEEFLERYAAVHQKPSTLRNTQTHVRNRLIPSWGHRQIETIAKQDIVRLLDSLMDEGKGTTANRVFATTRKLFGWAVERGFIEQSPTHGMKPPAKEVSRDRVLSVDEVRAIWRACDSLGYPFGPFLQVMFATGGQRESDVAGLRWDQVHGDWWVIEEPTKSKEPHRVPLSPLALSLLGTLPRFEGPFAFSTRGGEVPISGFSKGKAQIDELSGVTGWRIHDVRRTVATGFADHLGLHPYVVEAVQNRRSGTVRGVAKVYNRATYDREKRKGLEAWGDWLTGILRTETVVPLRG